jgi:hypothetical protein
MALSSPANEVTLALDHLRLDSDRRLAGIGLSLLLVPALWFIRADFDLFGGDWAQLSQRLLLRSVLIIVPAAGFVIMRVVKTREAYSRAVFWLAILTAALTLGLNLARPAGSGLPLRAPLLVMTVLYFAMPNRPMLQCLPPLGLGSGIAALRLTWLSGGPVDVGGDVIAIAALNALGVLAVARRVRLEEATSDVARELKTLRGIIPICSHCRKLRTEVGDWQQLERYFKDRSEALFSHGICPDCLATLYKDGDLR